MSETKEQRIERIAEHWFGNWACNDVDVRDAIHSALTTFAEEEANKCSVFTELQERAFLECLESGWDPQQKNTFAEEVAHLHEEISEAFRAFRLKKDCSTWHEGTKPCGVPSEFADAIIGMLYNAQLHGFDLFEAVEAKLQYNKTRSYISEGRQLHWQPLPEAPKQD